MSITTPEETTDSKDDVLARAMAAVDATQPLADPADAEQQSKSEAQDKDDASARGLESELDDIDIQVEHRVWHVEGDIEVVSRRGGEVVQSERNFTKDYEQKPLSFTGMMQFTGLIGEKLSEAMAGPEGLTVDGVMGDAQSIMVAGQMIGREDFSSVDAFVKGLAKLATYAPTLIEECQCIWLRIPYHERPLVKEIWSRSPEDGGLSVEEGTEMLELFLAQNYAELEDFFVRRLARLSQTVSKLRARASRQSKPSKRTRAATPRR